MGVEFDQTVYPDIDVLRYIIVYMKLYIYMHIHIYIHIYYIRVCIKDSIRRLELMSFFFPN